MALVRCPSCGRVADGKICFACGYEWPAGATAPPAPAPEAKVTASQAFKIASPSSFPTAARMPPPPSEEVNLDVEIDTDEPEAPPPAAFPPFAPAPPPAFAPAFPTTSAAPHEAFPTSPPPAFPSTPSAAAPAFQGFGGAPPPAFGQAAPSGFPGFPPPAFPAPSGSWGAPPPVAPPMPAFPSPSGNWGPPPAFPSMDTVPAPTAPAQPVYSTPAAPVSPPIPSRGFSTPAPIAPPPALNGLFDNMADAPVGEVDLDVAVTEERPVPATLEELPSLGGGEAMTDNSVRDATQDAGDFFNFTLEPGSTVEPGGTPEPSPFDDGALDFDAPVPMNSAPDDGDVPADVGSLGALDVAFTFSGDMPAAPPPPMVMGASQGFAEIDSFDVDTEASAPPPPASDGLEGLSFDDLPVDDLRVDDLPPVVGGLAEDDFSLAGLEDPLPPLPRTPPPMPPEEDFSIATLDDEGLAPPPSPPPEDEFSLDDDVPPPPAAAVPGRPTLSSRVGQLAESLEDLGRINDAALLYEVQAVLSASGR